MEEELLYKPLLFLFFDSFTYDYNRPPLSSLILSHSTKAFILPNKSPFTFIPLHMYMCVYVQMCVHVYV